MNKKIQTLAIESLYDKWFDLDEDDGWKAWTRSCAFCDDCEGVCGNCIINELPICSSVMKFMRKGDKSPIIEALEELALYGELTPEVERKLGEITR